MRSASYNFRRIVQWALLLVALIAFATLLGKAQQKINPNTQITWPAACAYYNVSSNTCPPIGGINFRGAWSSSTTYAVNDAVSDAGSAYLSLQAGNLNHNPLTSPTFWALLASGGVPGGPNGSTQFGNNGSFGGTSPLIATAFAGGDIGAQINAAYAAGPADGVTIYVPVSPSGQWWTQTTPIVFATINKPVKLICAGSISNISSTTSRDRANIQFAGTGTAVTVDTGTGIDVNHGVSTIDSCGWLGTNPAGTQQGLQVGVTNGATFFHLKDSSFGLFGKGIDFGQNTFNFHMDHSSLVDDAVLLNMGPEFDSGENMVIDGASILTEGAITLSSGDWKITDSSLDIVQITNSSILTLDGAHIEAFDTTELPMIINTGYVQITNGGMFQDQSGGSASAPFIAESGNGTLVIMGELITSNTVLTNWITLAGNATVEESMPAQLNQPFSYVNPVGNSGSGRWTWEESAGAGGPGIVDIGQAGLFKDMSTTSGYSYFFDQPNLTPATSQISSVGACAGAINITYNCTGFGLFYVGSGNSANKMALGAPGGATTYGDSSGNWVAPGEYFAGNGFEALALGTAISGTNFNSSAIGWGSSFWNGTAAVGNFWSITDVLDTGTNPTDHLRISWTGGTPGAKSVDLNEPLSAPNITVTGITGSTQCLQANSVGLASGTGLPCNTTLSASLTTTNATSDVVTITGMVSGGHCGMAATNATAATNIVTSYISAYAANQITLTHTALSGMIYHFVCTPY